MDEKLEPDGNQMAMLVAAFLRALCEREAARATPGFKYWTDAQQAIAIGKARIAMVKRV